MPQVTAIGRRFVGVALIALGMTGGLGLSAARAQDTDQLAGGPVVALANGQAIVATPTGPVTVQLEPDTRYEMDSPGTLADVQPGEVVGVTGHPENGELTAVEIHVFPTLLNIRQAQTQMTGANAGNLMTNARVESFANGVLTLNLAGQLIPINTSPATSVTHPVPVGPDSVQQDSRIAASGPVGPDGVIQARVVWIPALH
ncbi:MAG TPA: DUF5666 domain-containing protein [Chloroflexota bacterium]|nr:DUF5666 domain-containing protein [Chloroflexota bacterium]